MGPGYNDGMSQERKSEPNLIDQRRKFLQKVGPISLLFVALWLSGCAPSQPEAIQDTPSVEQSELPTAVGAVSKSVSQLVPTPLAVEPSATPVPTSSPVVVVTVTPGAVPPVTVVPVDSEPAAPPEPIARITRPMNLRSGPGTGYPIVGEASSGDSFPIIGVNAQGDWWQIAFDGGAAWVYGPLATSEGLVNGEIGIVAVAEAPTLPTPLPATTAQPKSEDPGSVPAPAPVGTVVVYETSVTLPTYPYDRYLSDARNEVFNWPYKRFDQERYRQERPAPENRTYKLLVLENAYLKVTVLPELGGRIWQAIHKPTGANLFYQNPVVKPSPWGPPEQLGWLAVGGLEWSLPVVEHGYAWGVPWGYSPLQHSPDLASITLFTPQDGRYLAASVTVTLRAGAAEFDVEPTISNVSDRSLNFAFWATAQLAPGNGNKPSAATHFLLPGTQMTVHSTGDARLPAPGQPIGWPTFNGVDYAWLGNYQQWAGFFERPAAHGPYTALYDQEANAGVVRIYPATVARGSKAFALGWQAAIDSSNFTDDGSAYVELHGGLAPTFDDTYPLPPGGAVSWREVWYPVHGIGGLSYADEVAAIYLASEASGLAASFYPTRPMDGQLVASLDGQEVGRLPIKASPDAPFVGGVFTGLPSGISRPLRIHFEDAAGHLLFETDYRGPLP